MIWILLLFSLRSDALTLDEALQSALSKNETLSQGHERVVQAGEVLNQAKSGPLPTLAFNADHTIQPPQSDPLFRAFSPEHQTTARVTLTQPLFRGFREYAALRQRGILVDAERANQVGTVALLYEAVASSYYEVLSFEQDLRNLEDQRRLYSERVQNLLRRARRGESARNEPLTAQSTEAVVEAEIQVVMTKLKSARENFSYLTGLPWNTELTDTKMAEERIAKVQPLEFYLKKVSERPDIVAAKQNREAASEGVSIAKGSHWPTLDLVGNYYLERPGYLSGVDWDVQFRFSLPIYEGGLRVAETRQASSMLRSNELEVSRLLRSAEAEIRTLHESLVIRVKHLTALKRATELSRSNSQMLERDFRRGLTRSIDVQAALAEYGVARRNFDQARYAAHLDLIRLERAANILPPLVQNYSKEYAFEDKR